MLKIVIPDTKEKIQKQIYALRIALSQDVSEKDRQIHRQALKDSGKALKALEGIN